MAETAPTRMVLRVGLIQGGKLVRDRLIRPGEPVTIGRATGNTLVAEVPGLPESFRLFEARGGVHHLRFTGAMGGRLSAGELPAVELAALREGGQALAEAGGAFGVELRGPAKGQLRLGAATVLFQLSEAPRREAVPTVARAGVSGFFLGADRLFFGLLLGCLTVSYSIVGVVSAREVTEVVTLDQIPDRMVKMIMPERPQERPPEPQAEEAVAAQEAPKAEAAKTSAPPKGPPSKSEIERKVGAAGLLAVIGSDGDGSGALDDVLSSGSGPANVASALADATRIGLATVDSLGSQTRGGGAGATAGIGDLGTTGGGQVALAAKREVVVARVETMGGPEVESSAVDREAVARFVRGRLAGIRACYERELKHSPSLKGKIVVRFVISTSGRVSTVEIEENGLNQAVESCIRTLVRGWSLPFKPDEEVPVSYPFLFQPSAG